MKCGDRGVKGGTVILAAGDFPKKGGAARRLLESAVRVVACDSAARTYRRHFGKWPTVIIGDFDSFGRPVRSVSHSPASDRPLLIRDADQETNDLEKAIAYCRRRGWKRSVIVGATGRREDHTLGNVFRALEHRLEIVTDCGRFVPFVGKATLSARVGAALSVFATDPKTRMTSKGLAWPLDGVRFRNLFCATLNRATASRITLTSTRPVSVYLACPG